MNESTLNNLTLDELIHEAHTVGCAVTKKLADKAEAEIKKVTDRISAVEKDSEHRAIAYINEHAGEDHHNQAISLLTNAITRKYKKDALIQTIEQVAEILVAMDDEAGRAITALKVDGFQ